MHFQGKIVSLLKKFARETIFPIAKSKPDFLIIGTQKAGTTSLYNYLLSHPRIISNSGAKELHFFNLYYDRGLVWYLSHFPYKFRKGNKLCFEATPDYLYHAFVPGRIKRDLGNPKLIVVLREPASRAYSAWKMWHSFADRPDRRAKADTRSFAEAIREEMAAPEEKANRPYNYVAMGKYAEQIGNYLAMFPKDDILILDYAEMNRDLHTFLSGIYRFLDVEPLDRSLSDGLKDRRYWVGPVRPMTAEEQETIAFLKNYYAPHNRSLCDLVGRRFDW